MRQKPWDRRKIDNRRIASELREPKETFLIVCEGEKTEPAYFDSFKVKSALIHTVGSGKNTVSLVEKAIRLRDDEKRQDDI